MVKVVSPKKGNTAPARKPPNFFGPQTIEEELDDMVRASLVHGNNNNN
jgi:hypothetical protein